MRRWLKEKRKSNGLTIKETAKRCEISESYYQKIELGERNVSVFTAQKIASALGFDWQNFFV